MNPYHVLENYFSNRKNLFSEFSLFEAGFYDFGYVLDLYYKLPFKKYDGLEKYKECELRVLFKNADDSRSSGGAYYSQESIYDRYLRYCENTQIRTPINIDKFSEIFTLKFETPIEQYINENSTINELFDIGFDIGIFSKLFHKFSDKNIPKKIVSWFYKTSKVNSFLYFTVMTSEEFACKGIDDIYTQEDISELKACFPGKVVEMFRCDSFETYLIRKNVE